MNTSYSFIQEFGISIDFDVSDFLYEFSNFYKFQFPKLVSFFSGKIESISVKVFRILDNLILDSIDLNSKLQLNDYRLSTLEQWEMVEYLDAVSCELLYFTKISKFLRSTIATPQYTSIYEFNNGLQHETIEHHIQRTLNEQNYNNVWVDVAKRNDLQELGYSESGGQNIILSIDLTVTSGEIVSILDNIQGDKVLGLDLQKMVEFADDDLKVLPYEMTFQQSVDILAGLLKGDIPEFLELGKSHFVGLNENTFAFATLVRQFTQVFSTDDSITNFRVRGFASSGGDIFFEYEVSSRTDLIERSKIQIN